MAILYGLALLATGMMIGGLLIMRAVINWRREGRILRFKIDGPTVQECVVISLFEYEMAIKVLDCLLFDEDATDEDFEDQSRDLSNAAMEYTNWILARQPVAKD